MVCITLSGGEAERVRCMAEVDVGSFDTRYERLTEYYRDLIERGQLKPGDRFPSARELSEKHGVGRTTSGRVHGTLISVGLIEHRPGVGTFVLAPPPDDQQEAPALAAAAHGVVDAFDGWGARNKPQALVDAVSKLRDALG
jgi:DNA-binding FadR family transcriptional regulator